jgi:hypothetical protein
MVPRRFFRGDRCGDRWCRFWRDTPPHQSPKIGRGRRGRGGRVDRRSRVEIEGPRRRNAQRAHNCASRAQRLSNVSRSRSRWFGISAHSSWQERTDGREAIRSSDSKSHDQQLAAPSVNSPAASRWSVVASMSPEEADRKGRAASVFEPSGSSIPPVEQPKRGATTVSVRHHTHPSRPSTWRWTWLSQSSPVVA